MVLAKNTTHTHQHTHKSYNRLNVQCTKQQQQFVVVARSSTWSAVQDCSPTVATTNTNSKKQSPTVSVYPLPYAIWRAEILFKDTKFSFSTCLLWTLRNIVHIIQWIRRNTIHSNWILRLLPTYNWHWAIPSTEYSMYIAQYCPPTIHCFWDCTIKSSYTRLTQHIAHTFNIKSRRSITPCNNIPSPTVQ